MKWFWYTLSSPVFHGKRLLHKIEIKASVTGMASSDAAFVGEGFVWNECYAHRVWPQDILDLAQRAKTKSINFLEAWTTVDMVATFGEEWRGKRVTISCDNLAWCMSYTNTNSKCEYLTVLLLAITHMTVVYDISLNIVHIKD